MKLEKHIIASAAVSGGVFAATGSAAMAIAALVAGVFIDVDHFYDYWENYSFDLNISKFFNVCLGCDFKKTRLLLHSIEFLLVMAVSSYYIRSWLLTGITLGICQHLAFDQITNRVYPASYSFIYRWLNGFKTDIIFNDIHGKTHGNN